MKHKSLLYSVTAILGGMLFGYDTAVINGAMPFFTAFFDLSDAMKGWAVSSGLLGCVIGACCISKPADILGRRETMKIIALLFILSAIGTGTASAFSMFITARILGGIAVGAVSVVLPIYISETETANKRGGSAINFQLGVVIGILVAFAVDYLLMDTGKNNWRYMFLSMGVPAFLFGCCLFFVKRSPRWLIMKGRDTEAFNNLSLQYGKDEVDTIVNEIKSSFVKKDQRKDFFALFRPPYLRFIIIGIAVGIFSQLSGIAIVIYYATDIFRDAGFGTNAAIGQTVIIGLVNLTFTLLAKHFIDRLGRRKLLLAGTIGMAILLSLLSASFFGVSFPSWMLLVFLVCFVASFASSMGAVSWVLLSEIFPNKIRSAGMSIGSLSNWAVNGCVSFLFPVVTGAFVHGAALCFGFFAIATFSSFLFFKKYLFETKNKTLEEIEIENS